MGIAALIGTLVLVADLALFAIFSRGGEVSIFVAGLGAATTILVVLVGVFAFKEIIDFKIGLGIALAIAGVFLMTAK